ncbi:MAG: adenosine deaminase [Candidatus Bipolaricaulia bacterium]
MPKVELHCHLDGSLRPATIWELAQTENVRLPVDGPKEVRRFFTADKHSLDAYLELFHYSLRVLQRAEHIARAVGELLEDFASENGVFMEVRFAPLLHLDGGLSPERVVEAALDGLRHGRAETGVDGGLILCGMRQESPQRTRETARLASAYKEAGVLAFDLAGPERDFPPTLHEDAITHAKDAGLGVTLHAGEEPCPDHIEQALQLGADRLGHGLYLHDSPWHVREGVVREGVPLEMCPTSNLQTARFASYADHPIADYLRDGVNVTVSTDNRLMSNTTVTDELSHLASAFGWGEQRIRAVLANAADAAFGDGVSHRWHGM